MQRIGKKEAMGLFAWLFGRAEPQPSAATLVAPSERAEERPAPVFAVIDVETTGLSPQRDRILELAIIRLDEHGEVVDEWVSRFDPDGPVGATHIHGISAADVAGKPRFADLASSVMATLSGLVVVAHNARFDIAFLRNELETAGWSIPRVPSYCTLDASWAYLPEMERRRLVDCCWATNVRLDEAHSALGDARAAAGLLRAYLAASGGPDPILRDAVTTARSMSWPVAASSTPRVRPQRSARDSRRERPPRTGTPRLTSPPLLQQLTAMSLLEVLDEGAPAGATAYLELLFDVLEDGDISDGEAAALQELCDEYALAGSDVQVAHEAFLLALAHRAVADGRVSHEERRELREVASLLHVAESTVKQVLDRADDARRARLSAKLVPLPDPWPHGEPLRVGDRVVFTGCDDAQRARLEQRAEQLGVRVMTSVSRLTTLLVTDGSFAGGKLTKAQQLATRTVHPDTFEVLLQHLQPVASDRAPAPVAQDDAASSVSAAAIAGGAVASVSPARVRAWATAAGFEVGVRGRLPKDVVAAFEAAHS